MHCYLPCCQLELTKSVAVQLTVRYYYGKISELTEHYHFLNQHSFVFTIQQTWCHGVTGWEVQDIELSQAIWQWQWCYVIWITSSPAEVEFWISSLIRHLSLMAGAHQLTATATVEVSQLTFCVSWESLVSRLEHSLWSVSHLTALNIELTDTNCVLCDLIYPETERVAGGDGLDQVGSNPCNSKLNFLMFIECW